MNSYLAAVLLAVIIWLAGYFGQYFAITRYSAPRWLVRLCLITRKDDRLAFGATMFQLLAYELLLLMLVALVFVSPDSYWAGIAIDLSMVACVVGDFLLLRSLFNRA